MLRVAALSPLSVCVAANSMGTPNEHAVEVVEWQIAKQRDEVEKK